MTIETYFLNQEKQLPFVINDRSKSTLLEYWLLKNKKFVEATISKHGAILFRNFVLLEKDFEQCIEKFYGNLIEDSQRLTKRKHVKGKIYTTTEFSPSQHISLHTENSFAYKWPWKIFFFCVVKPHSGGETPLANMRNVYANISEKTQKKFLNTNLMYVRNFWKGFGPSWQEVFNVTTKEELEQVCAKNQIQHEWIENRLRIKQTRPAIIKHPFTKEYIWFNHINTSHILTLEADVREIIIDGFCKEDYPHNIYYENGEDIEEEVFHEIICAYEKEKCMFSWEQGDLLMVDNMFVAHGREPFTPPRKIVVAMASPLNRKSLEDICSNH